MLDWWRHLNGAKKVVAGISAALVSLGLGFNLYHTYEELPAITQENAADIDTLKTQFSVLDAKLDRVLCLLVLEDSEDPLVCEMGN